MKVVEAALGILFVGLALTGVLLLNLFPYAPSSLAGWVLLVVVGIPLYVLLEGLGELVFNDKVGRRTSDKDFSGARILFGVVLMLAFYGIVYLVWQAINEYVRPYFTHLFG